MKTLFSGLTLLMQIVLVVAGVLVFAWFDPFNIFTNSKLSIRDTPSHVRQIKEIGELITAEYYGEVISSYYDKEIQEAKLDKNRIKLEVEALDESFCQELKSILNIDNEKDQLRQFNVLCEKLENQQRFFVDYINVLKKIFDIEGFNQRKKILENLHDYDYTTDKKARIAGILKEDKVKETEKRITDQIDKRKQLILLARGKVQAGFKFSKLDGRNVKVDTLHNRIIVVGFNPEILSCSINPWFIPELGIKGFEIIDMAGRADEVKIFSNVKASCRDSLQMKAIQSGILEKATRNAEKNLQTFFSIILNNKDISVKIVANELDYYDIAILSEKFITLNEFKLLDTLLGRKFTENEDVSKVFKILNNLKTKNLVVNTDTIQLHLKSNFDSIARKYSVNQEMLTLWKQSKSRENPN